MKKFIGIILFVLAVITLMSVTVLADDGGECGDAASWYFESYSQVLTVAGSGSINDYPDKDAPWLDYKAEIKKIVIESGIERIGDCAFYNCYEATEIVIPDSVISIGRDAFVNTGFFNDSENWEVAGGSYRGELYIDSFLIAVAEEIGGDYEVREGTSVIADYAFYGRSVPMIVLPETLTHIGKYAFAQNGAIIEIILPENLQDIGEYAFYGCDSLMGVSCGVGITEIKEGIFENCTMLMNCMLTDFATTIGKRAFAYTGIENVDLHQIESIGESAFEGCYALSRVAIYNENAYIESDAFSGCESLVLHGGIGSTTEEYAMGNDIPFEPFFDVISGECGYGLIWEYAADTGCLYVSGEGDMYDYSDENPAPWIEYIPSMCIIDFGGEVTSIGANAFANSMVMSLTLPSNITSIGDYAFCGCADLIDVYVNYPRAVIGEGAFAECPNLTIFGYENSSVLTYAEENDIPYETIYCYHRYGDSVTVNEQTCTQDGSYYRECADCLTREYTTVTAVGHKYTTLTVLPTCTEEGYTTYTCSECGDSYDGDTVEAAGHSFGEWVFECDPAVNQCTSKYRVCSKCGVKEVVEIEAAETENALFAMSDAKAKPGETVKIKVSLKTDAAVNSIALNGITYDANVLEFVAFSDYEHLDDMIAFPIVFDEEKMNVLIAFSEAAVFDGDICTIEFKVKEDVLDCTTEISANPIAKRDSNVFSSTLKDSEITVYTYVRGDIDGDEDVDVDDAISLFCYTMIPEDYPVDYPGDMDVTKDGEIDIDDAVYLFNYSMLPELYPLAD